VGLKVRIAVFDFVRSQICEVGDQVVKAFRHSTAGARGSQGMKVYYAGGRRGLC
jgi:hypothetical protein